MASQAAKNHDDETNPDTFNESIFDKIIIIIMSFYLFDEDY